MENGKFRFTDKELNDDEESSSSSSDCEDSEGDMIDSKFNSKFLQIFEDIRNKGPQLKESTENYFKDEDFNMPEHDNEKKAFTLKD